MTMLKIIMLGWRAGGCRDHAQGQDRHAARTTAPPSGDHDHASATAAGRVGAALNEQPPLPAVLVRRTTRGVLCVPPELGASYRVGGAVLFRAAALRALSVTDSIA